MPIIGLPPGELDPRRSDMQRLGLWPAPRSFEARDLALASCQECREFVWIAAGQVVDRETFAGFELLSLHPCCHDLQPEDLDDPDWGWVRCDS